VQLIVGTLAVCGLAGSGVASAGASTARLRVGTAAALPSGAKLTAPLPAAQKLSLMVALEPRDASAMQARATAVSTPGSPEFRHYLSVSQFAQTYGATAAQIAAVQSALRAQGLSVGTPMANHLTLSVTGSAAQVERAFATKLDQVKLAGGRSAYADTVAPTLPPSLAPYVQGVVGLDNVNIEHPEGLLHNAHAGVSPRLQSNVVTGGPQPCATASAEGANHGGYTADTIASAYDFSALYGAGDLGAGQTIALYELEPDAPADIAAYQACYGTATSVTDVPVDGFAATGAGSGEAELDIEQVIGLAPAAKILVYQAPNTGAGALADYSTIVSQDAAKVVSSSWGGCEANSTTAEIQAENTMFQEAALQGQSVFAASGDSGSAACSQGHPSPTAAQSALAVGDPASQPFVTGVGGTTLYTSSSSGSSLWSPGDPLDEAVWNDGNGIVNSSGPSGSTGGISKNWPMPSYQSGAPATLGVATGGSGTPCASTTSLCREVPDVSADADPVSGYAVFLGADGGWTVDGGTSAAAPLWAAFTALANASGTCRGLSLGFENPALYQIAGSSAYGTDFRDVTLASPVTGQANNDAVGTNNGLYPVQVGYDMATGLGTPIAAPLAASLCSARAPVYTVTVGNPGPQSTVVGHAVSLQATASDSGGAAVGYVASGLPAGLTINALNGLISGTPTTPGSTSVTVTATDSVANVGSTTFTWTIANPPLVAGRATVKSDKLSGIPTRKPKLSVTFEAGTNAPALKSVSVTLPNGLSFANKAKSLAKGIGVKDGGKKVKFKAKVQRGRLTITFKTSQRTATITIGKPAISVSRSLASKVKHHKIKRLSVGLRATDTANTTTKISIKPKV
jgi:kumamolisin